MRALLLVALLLLLGTAVHHCSAVDPLRAFEGLGFEVATSSNGLVVATGNYFGFPGAYEWLSQKKDGANPATPAPTVINGSFAVHEWTKDGWVQLGPTMYGSHHMVLTGFSVALSDDGYTLAVGSPGDMGDDAGNGPHQGGQVQVYRWDGVGQWTKRGNPIRGEGSQVQLPLDLSQSQPPLSTNDGSAGDAMGIAVDISGDGNVLACMSKWSNGGSSGKRVRVFAWAGTDWVERTGVISTGGNDFYSPISLSRDGSTLTAGVTSPTSNMSYVMAQRWTSGGSSGWQQVGELMEIGPIDKAPPPGQWALGVIKDRLIPQQVSADGLTVIAGMDFSAGDSVTYNTSVHVYTLQGGSWGRKGSPFQSDDGWSMGRFVTVSDDGSQIAMGSDIESYQGSPIVDATGLTPPCARLYKWSQGSWARRNPELCVIPLVGTNALRLSGDGSSVVLMNITADTTILVMSYLATPPPNATALLSRVVPGATAATFTDQSRFDFTKETALLHGVDMSQIAVVDAVDVRPARRMLLQSSLQVDYTVAYNSADFPAALADAIDAPRPNVVVVQPDVSGASACADISLQGAAAIAAMASLYSMLF
jgi:hypothetical protein